MTFEMNFKLLAMKSFLKFIVLTVLYVILFSVFPILIDGSFEAFGNHFAVSYTLFFLSTLSFVYVYVFEKLKPSQSLLYRLTISCVIYSLILILLGCLIQYYLLNHVQYQALFLQIVLGICLFMLQFLILNFVQNFKSKNELTFSDKPLYYVKVLLTLTFAEYLLLLIMSIEVVMDDFSMERFLQFSQSIFSVPFVINVVSFLSLKYLNKLVFFKSKNLLLISSSIIIGVISCFLFSQIYFKFKLVAILMYGLFDIFATLFFFTFVNYRDKLKNSLVKIHSLSKSFSKKEAEYLQLKNQINPHFLFNNLNTLISFIELNPKKAVEFGHNLSNVYRYYLKNQTEDFVSLQSELTFIKEYLEIYKAKFDNGFSFKIDDIDADYYVLASAIQELIDNIFKHNILDDKNPLTIKISIEYNYLIVQNSIMEKSSIFSTGIGLDNINKRYQILIQKPIVIEKSDNYFSVKLPILELQS